MEKGWCNCVAWCLSQAAAPHKTSPTLFHNSLGAGSLIWFKHELKDHRLRRVRSARYNYNKLAASVDRKYFSLDIYLRIRLIITVDITHLPALKSELNAWKDSPCFARVHPPPPRLSLPRFLLSTVWWIVQNSGKTPRRANKGSDPGPGIFCGLVSWRWRWWDTMTIFSGDDDTMGANTEL